MFFIATDFAREVRTHGIDGSMDLLAPFLHLLDKEVQFRGNQICLLDGMHALGAGLESFIAPPLIGDHFLDQFFGFGYGQVELGSSSSSVNVGSRCRCEPIVEALQDEPLVHAMMRIGQDIFLQPLPSFWDGFLWQYCPN